jgi:tripartite-type tricarboxylate transporter receptor subunit TctC
LENGMNHPIRLYAACTLIATTPLAAFAQGTYPNQPIRFIVGTAAGGGLDIFARLLAKELTTRAGQQVIVDNRAGAGTTIGSNAVAKAKPDGYTVLVNTSALAISPAIYKKLPYDTVRDLEPITLGASAPNLMVVHPSLPVKSTGELIALAKARANQGDPILYASGGNGTNGHMATALLISMAQIRMTHVPYKSGSLAGIDVIGGQVPVFMDTVSSVLPYVNARKLRALGVSSLRRAAAAPEIPTIAESGMPGYESAQWYGVLVPAGTPPEISAWLHGEITGLLRSASVRERLAAEGVDIIANTPDEFAALIRTDIAKWTKVVQTIGISLM